MKPNEEQALTVAYQRWLELAQWSQPPDRAVFTALGDAVRRLRKALDPFTDRPQNPNLTMLLCHMQSTQLNQAAQGHYLEMLEALDEPLRILDNAATLGSGGPGNQRDPRTTRWVHIAADAWQEHACAKPSSAEAGRFFRALEDFHQSTGKGLSVSARELRSALQNRDL